MQKYSHLFIGLSIALVYCVSVYELTYTRQFTAMCDAVHTEKQQTFSLLENKYAVSAGLKNPAGEKAVAYFQKQYAPRLFKKCDEAYLSVFSYTGSEYVAPNYEEWYHLVTRSGHYEQYEYHKIEKFSQLNYNYEITEQTETALYVRLKLTGKKMTGNDWYKIGNFLLTLDYDYNVKDIKIQNNNEMLPLFGKGKEPASMSCEYLHANLGEHFSH